MACSLLDLPPELIIRILSFLPIRALLKFSETSRSSRTLARSSLHSLSLGIYSSRVSSLVSELIATQYQQPKSVRSAFSASDHLCWSATSEYEIRRGNFQLESSQRSHVDTTDPYNISVVIPDARDFGYMTLLNFHNALTTSILKRHGSTLRNLSVSLWTFNTTIAKATADLAALRNLSIRVEDAPHVRSVPRNRIRTQRLEQHAAWTILSESAVWAPRLYALRIEGGEVTTSQLRALLLKNRWLRELWLCRCTFVGRELWPSLLGSEAWEGRATLNILGIMRCGGQLDERVLDVIGGLRGLQGCHGLDGEAVAKRNREAWGLKECVLPLPRTAIGNGDTIIEVDPTYLQDDEL